MADQLYLFTGTNFLTSEITLALDSDNLQALVPGTEMGVPEHTNTWSAAPDNLGFRLLDHQKGNRLWPVRLLIGNKDAANPANSMQNAFQKLLRLIKQARRFEMEEDVDPVGLTVLLDGATNRTMFLIKDMEFNGISVLDEPSRIWKNAQATFMMVTEPLGYGEEETLENWVKTPHMQEDINDDGLADNWNESGTPVTLIDTDIFLCGSQSQKTIMFDLNGTNGIESDTIACTAYQSDDFVCYAWVYRESENDDITLDVVGDDSGSLGTDTYDIASETAVGNAGHTWKRLEVIGVVGAADTTLTIKIERLTGDASEITTFFVDKVYLQFGVDTIPTGWCSQHLLYQHSHSAEGAVNYIDTEDILGDEDADTELKITLGSVGLNGYYYMSRKSNDRDGASTGFFMDVTGDQVDAARLGGTYWTTTASTGSSYLQTSQTIPNMAINGKSGLYRVFMSAQDDSADHIADAERADFRLYFSTSTGTQYSSTRKYPYVASGLVNDYNWLDLGVVDLSRHNLRNKYADIASSAYAAYVTRDSGSADVRMDGIFFIPVETNAFFVFDGNGDVKEQVYYASSIDTNEDIAFNKFSTSPYEQVESLGRIPRLYAGNFSRTFILGTRFTTGSPSSMYISDPTYYYTVQIKYRPRTTFLFGVSDVT